MIDWTKPIQTRHGLPARVLCTDLKNPKYPIAIAYEEFGVEKVATLNQEGRISTLSQEPFVQNVPERHKHADVIIAWANGAEIECRYAPENSGVKSSWSTFSKEETPTWANDLEYRVKPE